MFCTMIQILVIIMLSGAPFFYEGTDQSNAENEHVPISVMKIDPNLKDYATKKYVELVDIMLTDFPREDVINNEHDHELVVNTMYKRLTDSMKMAYLQLSKTITKYPKRKGSWFTEELRTIKSQILNCREIDTINSTEDSISDLKYWKNKFRRIQRRNTRSLEKQKYKDIEKLSKESDKDRFWRRVRQAKMTEAKEDVTANIEDIKNHFAMTFASFVIQCPMIVLSWMICPLFLGWTCCLIH